MDAPRLDEAQFRQWIADYAGYLGLPADQVQQLLDKVSFEEVQDRIHQKDGIRRFLLWMYAVADLLSSGQALLDDRCDDLEETARKLLCHARTTWEAATELHQAQYYPLGAAIALTGLEEAGKLAVERYRLAGVKAIDLSALPPRGDLGVTRKGASFYHHRDKQVLAALGGALINNRLDRILGVDYISWLLHAAETGQLEKLRQSYLYCDRADYGLQLPGDLVGSHEGAKIISLAGEVLAEVGLFDLKGSERILSLVRDFERSAGLPFE